MEIQDGIFSKGICHLSHYVAICTAYFMNVFLRLSSLAFVPLNSLVTYLRL